MRSPLSENELEGFIEDAVQAFSNPKLKRPLRANEPKLELFSYVLETMVMRDLIEKNKSLLDTRYKTGLNNCSTQDFMNVCLKYSVLTKQFDAGLAGLTQNEEKFKAEKEERFKRFQTFKDLEKRGLSEIRYDSQTLRFFRRLVKNEEQIKQTQPQLTQKYDSTTFEGFLTLEALDVSDLSIHITSDSYIGLNLDMMVLEAKNPRLREYTRAGSYCGSDVSTWFFLGVQMAAQNISLYHDVRTAGKK